MRPFSYIVTLLTAFALMGCGAGMKKDAAAPESDPWKDYKGTFAAGVPTKEELKKAEEPARTEKTGSKSDEVKVAKSANDDKPGKPAKKTLESKAAESKPVEAKPVPVSSNDPRSMYADSGDTTAAPAAANDDDATPTKKKGGKKAGKKTGKKAGKKADKAPKN